MSASLLEPIDPEALAVAAAVLEGEIPLARMPRLAALLVEAELSNEGAAQVAAQSVAQGRFHFSRDGMARLILSGELSAQVPMECQRCLEPVWLPLKASFELAIVDSGQQADALPDDIDPLIRERRLIKLVTVAEDELLVAMPLVARHEEIKDCGPMARDERLVSTQAAVAEDSHPDKGEPRTQRPFQVLDGLKGSKGKQK